MSIDLNQADEQRECTGPIPPKSIVPVRLTLRQQGMKNGGDPDPFICTSASGYKYLDGEFEVLAGQFQGAKFWENFGVDGRTEKQMQGVRIAKSKLRAMVEAARNVNPKDASPQAVAARRLNAWSDLQGLVCGVQVACEKPHAGDKYVNNRVGKVITPDHEFYAQVMNGQDRVSDDPIPEIPQAQAAASAPAWGAPAAQAAATPAPGMPPAQAAWAQPQAQVQPQGAPAGGMPVPAWAQKPAAPAHALGPAFPSEAAGMDDVPF